MPISVSVMRDDRRDAIRRQPRKLNAILRSSVINDDFAREGKVAPFFRLCQYSRGDTFARRRHFSSHRRLLVEILLPRNVSFENVRSFVRMRNANAPSQRWGKKIFRGKIDKFLMFLFIEVANFLSASSPNDRFRKLTSTQLLLLDSIVFNFVPSFRGNFVGREK